MIFLVYLVRYLYEQGSYIQHSFMKENSCLKRAGHHLEWAMFLLVNILRSQIHTEISSICMAGMNYWIHITKDSILCVKLNKKIKQSLKKQIKMLMWEYICHTNTCDDRWVWTLLFHSNPWSALPLCIKCSFCMHEWNRETHNTKQPTSLTYYGDNLWSQFEWCVKKHNNNVNGLYFQYLKPKLNWNFGIREV